MIDNDKIISMKKVLLILSFSLTPIIIFSLLWFLIGPVGNSDKLEVFTVPQETGNFSVVDSLYEQKFIRNKSAFNFLLQNLARGKEVKSGGYRLSQKMNAWHHRPFQSSLHPTDHSTNTLDNTPYMEHLVDTY